MQERFKSTPSTPTEEVFYVDGNGTIWTEEKVVGTEVQMIIRRNDSLRAVLSRDTHVKLSLSDGMDVHRNFPELATTALDIRGKLADLLNAEFPPSRPHFDPFKSLYL